MVWRWPWATEEWLWRLRDNALKSGQRGEPWYMCNWMSFTRPSVLGPVFFRTALPCSGGYHMERGGMTFHDAVEINCKKGETTENQGSVVKYMGYGVYLYCVCVLWLDMTTPPWCREKVVVYYFLLLFYIKSVVLFLLSRRLVLSFVPCLWFVFCYCKVVYAILL